MSLARSFDLEFRVFQAGAAYAGSIVAQRQFIQPGTKLTYAYVSVYNVAVTMTLRVYGA
jgi:hypothetical protein